MLLTSESILATLRPFANLNRKPDFKANALALMLVPVVMRLSGLLFFVLIGRYYGQREIGAYRSALVFAWHFLEFSRLGLNPLLLRDMASRTHMAPRTHGAALTIRIGASLVSWLIIAMFLSVTANDILIPLIIIFSLAIPFTLISETNGQAFIVIGRGDLNLLLETVGGTAYIALSILALWLNLGVTGLAVAKTASLMAQMAFSILLVQRGPHFISFMTTWPEVRALFLHGLPFAGIGVTAFVISEAEVIILAWFQSLDTVGLYVSGQAFISALKSIVVGIGLACAPLLAAQYRQNKQKNMEETLYRGVRLSAWVTLSVSTLVSTLGLLIIITLLGQEFRTASLTFSILAWTLPFYGFCNLVGYGIMAAGGERQMLLINIIITILIVCLNLWSIPRFNPLLAPAIVSVGVYAFYGILYFLLARALKVADTSLFRAYLLPLGVAIPVGVLLAFAVGASQAEHFQELHPPAQFLLLGLLGTAGAVPFLLAAWACGDIRIERLFKGNLRGIPNGEKGEVLGTDHQP
jgi:O-antigen/teichoic acid export membrane protein